MGKSKPVLTAFRHAVWLLLFWRGDTPPRTFRLVLNDLEMPTPYLGLPLGRDRNRALYIIPVDPGILGGKVKLKILHPEGTRLAAFRKIHLPEFSEQALANLSSEERRFLYEGLTKGLRQAFPNLEEAVVESLLRCVAGNNPSLLSSEVGSVPTTSAAVQTVVAQDCPKIPELPQEWVSSLCLLQLKRTVRRLGGQPEQNFILDVEHCGALPGVGLFFSGYLAAAPGRLRRMVLHLPAGRIDVTQRLVRTVRPLSVHQCLWAGIPVEKQPGFECFVLIDQPLAELEKGCLSVEFRDGTVALAALRPVVDLSDREVLDETHAFRLLEGFGPLLGRRSRQALQPVLEVLYPWLHHPQQGLEIQVGDSIDDVLFLQLDYVLILSARQLHLGGWLVDPQRRLIELHLCTALGDAVEVMGQISYFSRSDVLQFLRQKGIFSVNEFVGFHLRVELPLPLGAGTPLYLRLRLRDGKVHRLALQTRMVDLEHPLSVIRELLSSFPTWDPRLFSFYDQSIGPTVAQLWSGRVRLEQAPRLETFGTIPDHPQVSLVIPLYGRIDLMSYQLAQFANDRDFQKIELIYVLDDPRWLNEFVAQSGREFALFKVPFRTVSSGVNLGYAGATNLGADQAQGTYLLLLNSDVFPCRTGWVSQLVALFEDLANPGVLSPKLLSADGLIQHAGLTFFQEPTLPGFWFNEHPDRGLPNDGRETVPRTVDAVTGACMLLKRSVFQEIGGLSEDYILGDFEDSDLCLRLREAGYRIWYAPQVELYHLERLSFPHAGDEVWRTNLSRYNAWLHTRRWGKVIKELKENSSSSLKRC